jgi:hypothetical protein
MHEQVTHRLVVALLAQDADRQDSLLLAHAVVKSDAMTEQARAILISQHESVIDPAVGKLN